MLFRNTVLAAVGLATLAACSDTQPGSLNAPRSESADSANAALIASVSVTLASPSIAVGATTQATAKLRDIYGNNSSGTTSWSSSNTAVATVSSSGLVTGKSAGSATITARTGGFWPRSGSATITVTADSGGTTPGTPGTPGTVSDLNAAPSGSAVTLSFTQVNNGAGSAASYDIRYTPSPIGYGWGSATRVASGTCAAPVAGTATSGTFTCSVLGLSPSTQYDFQVVAFRGTIGQGAVYGSLSNVATVTTGTSGSVPTPVATTVTLAPATASVVAGATKTFTATVKDQNGATMTGQTVTWSSSSTGIATVNSAGVATGVAAGSATITATSSGKTGTATLTVTATAPVPVVTTVTLSPTSASIQVGATQALSATVKDQNGNTMSGQTVTWSSNNTGVVTVNGSGLVSGVAAGTATITGTSAGKSGTAMITVTASPPPPPPPGGGTLLFQEDFENTNMSSRGWYDNTNPALSTAEHVPGSASSVAFRWTPGAVQPTNGGSMRHKFTPSNSFYLSYYVKFSANWVGSGTTYHPHEMHVMSTLDDQWAGPADAYLAMYIEHSYQNGLKPRIGMQDNQNVNTSYGSVPRNLVGTTESRSVSGCNGVVEANMSSECWAGSYSHGYYNFKSLLGPVTFSPTPGAPGYKGDWNRVEVYFQMNTVVNGVGQANGVMQYWFNGQLVIDRHDILFRTGARATMMFEKYIIAPYIGDGSPVDQSMWIDNLKVATGRIP